MQYNLLWSTHHPGHLVYVLDLSESMKYNGKIDMVLSAITEVSDYLTAQCTDFDEFENRFSITIIGYNSKIHTLFKGDTRDLVEKLDLMYDKHMPLFDKNKEAKPCWQTYMADAFRAAEKDIKAWIEKQTAAGNQIPTPIIIHVTDGFPEEKDRSSFEAMCDAKEVTQGIKHISVPDGNVLFFNIHFSGNNADTVMTFPDSVPSTADEVYRKFLFDISSELPFLYLKRAQQAGFDVQSHSRFMVSNESSARKLVRLISFGSSVSLVSHRAG